MELRIEAGRVPRARDKVGRRSPPSIAERQGLRPKVSDDRPALAALPDETVVDGEVVALDATGRPSFNALQNGAARATIVYYVFDVMVLGGRDVMGEPLATRRDLLSRRSCPCSPIRYARRPGSTRALRI